MSSEFIASEKIPASESMVTVPARLKHQTRSDQTSDKVEVLVVDDEATQRELFSKVLSGSSVTRVAETLDEAMELVKRQMPDVVILDYELKGESGLDGIRRLRKLNAALPVIMVTGHHDLDVAREAIQEGAIEFVLKPFSAEDLLGVVKRVAKGENVRQESSEVAYSLQRRLAANVDLWRSRLPTAPSENRLVATLDSGRVVEAKILRLSRTSIQAEVYEPSFWTESGRDVVSIKAWIGSDAAYEGAGRIGTVITTGPSSVCELHLQGDWVAGDESPQISASEKTGRSAQAFVARWKDKTRLSRDFKLAISDIFVLLSELREWLAGLEFSWLTEGGTTSPDRETLEKVYDQVEPVLTEAFDAFESASRKVPTTMMGLYAEHVRNCLHPLMLSSPFVHRSFTKPLHYPGDYGVMNYMLGNPFEGESLFSRMLNAFVIRRGAPATYRYRVDHLEGLLRDSIRASYARSHRPCRVLSLGCGAAPEVQRILSGGNDPGIHAEFTLLDFSSHTVNYALEKLSSARHAGSPDVKVDVREFSVQQTLAAGTRLINNPRLEQVEFLARGHFDILYCVGLFDYLSDRVCERIFEIFWELGGPQARIVASNFTPDNPDKGFMDYILDWRLLYRGEAGLQKIASAGKCATGQLSSIIAPSGGEVFVCLDKVV